MKSNKADNIFRGLYDDMEIFQGGKLRVLTMLGVQHAQSIHISFLSTFPKHNHSVFHNECRDSITARTSNNRRQVEWLPKRCAGHYEARKSADKHVDARAFATIIAIAADRDKITLWTWRSQVQLKRQR
ncbi:MAG: hypothetical protein V8R14_06125 [Clostridia bacterium]